MRLAKSDLGGGLEGSDRKRAVAERFKDLWDNEDESEEPSAVGWSADVADDVAGDVRKSSAGTRFERKGSSVKRDSSAPELARIPEGEGIHTEEEEAEGSNAQQELPGKRYKRVQIAEEIHVIENEETSGSGSGSSDYEPGKSSENTLDSENTLGSEENLTMQELNATLMGDPNFRTKRYPGSPLDSRPSLLRETVKERTWSTFTKGGSVSPAPLNRLIVEKSADAALILINLPDPFLNMQPERYMVYCEELTQGLNRVLLVHGSGKEVVAKL